MTNLVEAAGLQDISVPWVNPRKRVAPKQHSNTQPPLDFSLLFTVADSEWARFDPISTLWYIDQARILAHFWPSRIGGDSHSTGPGHPRRKLAI